MGVGLAAVLHENKPEEVKKFKEDFWPDASLYWDREKAFFTELGGGRLRRASALSLLNPFSPVWRRASDARKNVRDYNLKGEGTTLGGSLVLSQDRVCLQFNEESPGERALEDDILRSAHHCCQA